MLVYAPVLHIIQLSRSEGNTINKGNGRKEEEGKEKKNVSKDTDKERVKEGEIENVREEGKRTDITN